MELDELNPLAVVFGLVGGGLAWYMSGSMEAGVLMKAITSGITAVACFVIVSKIANN